MARLSRPRPAVSLRVVHRLMVVLMSYPRRRRPRLPQLAERRLPQRGVRRVVTRAAPSASGHDPVVGLDVELLVLFEKVETLGVVRGGGPSQRLAPPVEADVSGLVRHGSEPVVACLNHDLVELTQRSSELLLK